MSCLCVACVGDAATGAAAGPGQRGPEQGLSLRGLPTERLVSAIQQNLPRFHRPPIGPLGTVLALKDNR